MKTVAIYGGAFDPPHLGHLEVVRKTMELPNVLFTMVVPSRNPPHKTPMLSYRQRMHMMKMMMRDAFLRGDLDKKPPVSNIETAVRGTTYTVDVLRHLPRVKNVQYRLVLGNDEVQSIMKWKQPDDIFSRVGIIIANRTDNTEIEHVKLSDVVAAAIEGALRINIGENCSISSSEIRSSIAVEGGWWRQFVPKSIVRYIEANGLYGHGKGL